METDRESLFNRTSAPGAELAGTAGVNLWPCSTSVFSFVEHEKEELTPACISHTFADVRLAKAVDVKFLDKDHAILVDQLAAQFVVKLRALIGNLLVTTANLVSQRTVLIASLAAAGAHLLQLRQPVLTGSKPAGILDSLTCRQGREVFKAHINANTLGWCGQRWSVRQFYLKHGVPIAQIVPLYDHHPNDAMGQRMMLKPAHLAHPLDVEPVALYPNPIIVDIADRIKPMLTLVARITRFLTILDSAEKSVKGFAQSAQGLLNRGVVDKSGILIQFTNRFELVSLVNIAKALSVHSPGQPALGQSIVIQAPVNFQDAVKRLVLFSIRKKAVLVREIHSIPSDLAF